VPPVDDDADLATRRLLADHVVTPTGVVHDALIEIAGSRLLSCQPFGPGSAGPEPERIAGWVVPGFLDTHVHGGGGFDYATEDPEAALAARAFHATYGTTTSFASLVTDSIDALCRQLSVLADLVAAGHFAGIHLEGPFLSPDRKGAHNPALLRHPDPQSVERLIVAGRGRVSMVTIAPELPGALAAIAQLTGAGIRVALGHTDADQDVIAAGLDAGATSATHLFNAMPGIHHRRPGPIPRLLTDPRVAVELIADGFHLHPDVLRMATAAAGAERTVLVTDAMTAAGTPDGDFSLGGLQVRVRDGMAHLVDEDGQLGSIAGSTLTMAAAFERMTGIVGDIAAVAAMASSTAARHFGLADVGAVEGGRRADLCVVDHRGALQRVMQAGQWLAEPAPR
jgi:N-acetylglucosamine-6-phosphate deacetylase